LSALRIGRLYLPAIIPGTQFCQRLRQPQGHRAAGMIMSIKNSSDTIGNRTRDLPVCSAVSQPTAPPRNPIKGEMMEKTKSTVLRLCYSECYYGYLKIHQRKQSHKVCVCVLDVTVSCHRNSLGAVRNCCLGHEIKNKTT
jgi:hypothetical protein